MCGIVGILGTGPVAGSIVDALKRLEYRGYDSAGVATLENGRLERRRAEGKLKNLEAKLAAAPLGGTIGIGHTRWATHGKPTENNAHPHASPRLAVVHNGIIENFRALRQELAAEGHVFQTETDSEIAAFVVEDELAKGKSPEAAVHAALGRLRGAFALVYLFEGEEDLLIGARQVVSIQASLERPQADARAPRQEPRPGGAGQDRAVERRRRKLRRPVRRRPPDEEDVGGRALGQVAIDRQEQGVVGPGAARLEPGVDVVRA